ncbi:MAG: ABC transporter permease, partial [Robiginitomaculum sp.]
MFARLLKFELSLHTKQIGFWVAAIIVFLVGFSITSLDWLSLGGNSGGERIKANGAINIASYSNLFSYIAIFFGAVFVVTGVMRDDVHKSLEIVHATPVTTSAMIWSRFAGVWAVTSLCVLAGVIGMAVGTLAPWADKETFAPFNLLHYIQPFFLFVVINTLFVTAFYTSIAAVTRNRSMVYISAVGLLMLTQMAGLLTLQSENDWLNSLISPFGDSAMDTVTEYWPPDEQNNRMVPLMGFIGANRLLWGGLSIAALLLSRRLFTRGIVSGKFKGVLADEGEPARLGSVSFASAKTQYGFGSRLSQFWTRFKYETLTTLRSTPFIILSLIGLIFFGITVYVTAMMSPEPVLPISSQLATIVTGGFSLFIYIIMIFFAGEIIWRDRIVGMTEILDATPTRNGVFMASKWASLMAIIAAALLFAIVCGMAIQLGIHRTPVEPMVFLKSIFIAVGTPLFLFAALILMIQSLSPGRVIGMIISAVAMIGLLVFAVQFPHGHPLMNYGMVSTGGFSDMNGFRNMTRYGWFLLYWGCLVGLFAVLSIWLWRRGVEVGLIARIKSIRSRMSLISIGAALASLIGFTAVGTSLYNAYDAKGFTTERQDELAFVAYENSLWEKAFDPAPGVISVRSDVQFYPEKGTAKITGTYALENRYDVPITEFYVGGRHYDELKSISIKGASQQDEAFDEVIRPKRKPAKKGDEDETEVEADTAPLETKPSEYTLKDFGYRRFV